MTFWGSSKLLVNPFPESVTYCDETYKPRELHQPMEYYSVLYKNWFNRETRLRVFKYNNCNWNNRNPKDFIMCVMLPNEQKQYFHSDSVKLKVVDSENLQPTQWEIDICLPTCTESFKLLPGKFTIKIGTETRRLPMYISYQAPHSYQFYENNEWKNCHHISNPSPHTDILQSHIRACDDSTDPIISSPSSVTAAAAAEGGGTKKRRKPGKRRPHKRSSLKRRRKRSCRLTRRIAS